MNPTQSALLQKLPKVQKLVDSPVAEELAKAHSRPRVVEAIREWLDNAREEILADAEASFAFSEDVLFDQVRAQLQEEEQMSLRRVVNATGIALHTNLGRSPLAEEALDAITDVARGYSNLELELWSGKRGSRYAHVENILCDLTGAEAVVVVNNNAAAVMLAINTLAKNSEVVTSRGELIEIGGSFRIPDVIERSEAELVEVGATNKTRLADYETVITDKTRVLLKVHPSNFRIVGFTGETTREELVALGGERSLIVMEDLGSGTLIDLTEYGLPPEVTVQKVVRAGVDVVTFSGDKLLGGPQAGIILGKTDYIEAMKKNPLIRALRIDKLSLAALEATLILYLNPDRLAERLPLLAQLTQDAPTLLRKAEVLAAGLSNAPGVTATVVEAQTYAGGGSLPDATIPTHLVIVRADKFTADALAAALRVSDPPIMARISDDAVVMDLRTIAENEIDKIIRAFERLMQ